MTVFPSTVYGRNSSPRAVPSRGIGGTAKTRHHLTRRVVNSLRTDSAWFTLKRSPVRTALFDIRVCGRSGEMDSFPNLMGLAILVLTPACTTSGDDFSAMMSSDS